MGGSTNIELSIHAQEARIILIGKCGCAKKVGQKQNMDSMWKTRHKDVDLEDPTPLIDYCIWAARKEMQRLILKLISPQPSCSRN